MLATFVDISRNHLHSAFAFMHFHRHSLQKKRCGITTRANTQSRTCTSGVVSPARPTPPRAPCTKWCQHPLQNKFFIQTPIKGTLAGWMQSLASRWHAAGGGRLQPARVCNELVQGRWSTGSTRLCTRWRLQGSAFQSRGAHASTPMRRLRGGRCHHDGKP